jgi:periplasmic protein CpxP/Spy
MKKLVVLGLVICLFAISSSAQVERVYADSSKREVRSKGASKGDKREMMKELNLSRDQMKQMRALKQETKAKMEDLKTQNKLTMEEKKANIKVIQEERRAKLKMILSAEQFAKMEAKLKEKKAGMDKQMIEEIEN